ncbi:MAG: hypothetical protein MUF18_09175 [Fimbriiglobus sp.]|nr:hypothetical protein [Fimbriiglobus sp.]
MTTRFQLERLDDRLNPSAFRGTPGDDVFLVFGISPTQTAVELYSSAGRAWAVVSDDVTIDAGSGNDQFWVIGAPPRNVSFTGSGGSDGVRLFNFPSASVLEDGPRTSVRPSNGGAGVSFDAATIGWLNIAGTAGTDTYRVSSGALRTPTHIDTGNGTDNILLGGLTNATVTTAGGVGRVGNLSFTEASLEWLYLFGTNGDDTLTVGAGVTRGVYLSGLGGDDTLYGGAGHDVIDGGAGNDGLFGGRGTNRLLGGAGADRFLDWTGGNTLSTDADTGDVVVRFTPGTAANRQANAVAQDWREDEITTIDTALAHLHRLTANTKLLKTATGQPMAFERWGAATLPDGSAVLGWNNNAGVLSFTSTAFNRGAVSVWATVYHEFAHNWDTPAENPFIPAFRDLSGWTQNPPTNAVGYSVNNPALTERGQVWFFRTTAGFARSYGWQGGPAEDYATTWETLFTQHFHGVLPIIENSTPNLLVPVKAANVWALVNSLR